MHILTRTLLALSAGVSLTRSPDYNASAAFPSDGSMTRRPASLHGVRVGPVPPLPRYYQDATTSRRPSRRASFPSLGGTIPARFVRSPRAQARRPRAWGFGRPVPFRLLRMETTGSPTFPRNPLVPLPCSPTPAGPNASDHLNASMLPPMCPRRRLPRWVFRGSITRLRHSLSTLRRMGHPIATQDSLPAAWSGSAGWG